ncbi:hypothetical protein OF83DRAFT_1086005 [Amylostereum chailletii]|nr:hypothetical protein OF83DRAFT_1086005 [Amylostereum chailletii]
MYSAGHEARAIMCLVDRAICVPEVLKRLSYIAVHELLLLITPSVGSRYVLKVDVPDDCFPLDDTPCDHACPAGYFTDGPGVGFWFIMEESSEYCSSSQALMDLSFVLGTKITPEVMKGAEERHHVPKGHLIDKHLIDLDKCRALNRYILDDAVPNAFRLRAPGPKRKLAQNNLDLEIILGLNLDWKKKTWGLGQTEGPWKFTWRCSSLLGYIAFYLDTKQFISVTWLNVQILTVPNANRCWGPGLVIFIIVVVNLAIAFDNYAFVAINAHTRRVPVAIHALALIAPPDILITTSPSLAHRQHQCTPSTPVHTVNTSAHRQHQRTPSTPGTSFNAPIPAALNAHAHLVPVALNALALVAPPDTLVATSPRRCRCLPQRPQCQRTLSAPVASCPIALNTPTSPASMPTRPSRSTTGLLSPPMPGPPSPPMSTPLSPPRRHRHHPQRSHPIALNVHALVSSGALNTGVDSRSRAVHCSPSLAAAPTNMWRGIMPFPSLATMWQSKLDQTQVECARGAAAPPPSTDLFRVHGFEGTNIHQQFLPGCGIPDNARGVVVSTRSSLPIAPNDTCSSLGLYCTPTPPPSPPPPPPPPPPRRAVPMTTSTLLTPAMTPSLTSAAGVKGEGEAWDEGPKGMLGRTSEMSPTSGVPTSWLDESRRRVVSCRGEWERSARGDPIQNIRGCMLSAAHTWSGIRIGSTVAWRSHGRVHSEYFLNESGAHTRSIS